MKNKPAIIGLLIYSYYSNKQEMKTMWIETKTDKNGKKVYKYNERYIDPKLEKEKSEHYL